jgi:hypothetical protein
MAPQTSNRDTLVYRGHIPDHFAPALVLGWILTLALFGVEHETRWGKMVLPSWGGWCWLANKILERIR